jgi:hypothetical protein
MFNGGHPRRKTIKGVTTMSDQKFDDVLERARQKLAEEAKQPRPQASTFADIEAFVEKSRSTVLPGFEYHKTTDTTLIVLQNLAGKKLEFNAAALPSMLEQAGTGGSYAKSVLRKAETALDGYRGAIATARNGGRPAETRATGHQLKIAS